MFTDDTYSPNIKVIGLGGGGGNAVKHMVEHQTDAQLDFIAANTDKQALAQMPEDIAFVLGGNLTGGLGAGADPNVGYDATMESEEELSERLQGADLVFITAGMGGGTGTGAAPVVARVAKRLDALTVAVVTRPFPFEGRRRQAIAEAGIKELAKVVDSLIVIPNERLLSVLGNSATILSAFATCNDVLRYGVNGIAEMITCPGMINVDFADVRTVLSSQGRCKIGMGIGKGANRAEISAQAAINSPLLEQGDIAGATGVLVNITAGPDLSIGEFNEIGQIVKSYLPAEATIVTGTSLDMSQEGFIKVSIVAAGLPDNSTAKTDNDSQTPSRTGADHSRGPNTEHNASAPALPTAPAKPTPKPVSTIELEHLDIPAFLRRSIS